MNYPNLNPKKALIWRIIHQDNLAWLLVNGLHCGNSKIRSPNWVTIGNEELIQKRAERPVPLLPYGVLNDYIPFYFTPFPLCYTTLVQVGVVYKKGSVQDII